MDEPKVETSSDDSKSKLSRKFLISHTAMGLSAALPVLYKYLAISDSITMVVIGIVGSSALGYNIVNAQVKKVDPND